MTFANWLLGACGHSHIGIYTCSICGYELLRSGYTKNNVISSITATAFTSLFPPATISAKDKDGNVNVKSTTFTKKMMDDFTKSFNLGRMLHKDSIIFKEQELKDQVKDKEGSKKFEISCGKCGSSFGHQLLTKEGSSVLSIKLGSVDLTFKRS